MLKILRDFQILSRIRPKYPHPDRYTANFSFVTCSFDRGVGVVLFYGGGKVDSIHLSFTYENNRKGIF